MFIKILALATVLMLLAANISCIQNTSEMVNKSIVQVWIPTRITGEPAVWVSFGIVVGDGNHVLTIMDYEEYSPGDLEVVTRDQERYNASVQSIDPRTGMTLLKLEGTNGLPVASIGSLPKYPQTVLIWESTDSDWTVPKSLTVSSVRALGPLFFGAFDKSAFWGGVDPAPGAVVTDKKGRVLGLAVPLYERLVMRLGTPPALIASIDSALELLSGDAVQRPWADGPVLSAAIASRGPLNGYSAGILSTPSDYDKMSIALLDLLGKLGEPIATDDLNLNDQSWYGSLEGTMLVVVYPWPVDLKGADGQVLAQAKWVGIQWDRSEGKPNRLIYGDVAYTIKGGFVIAGDISNLLQSVPPVR